MPGFAVRTDVVVLTEDALLTLLRRFAAGFEPRASKPFAELDSADFVASGNDPVVPDFPET